jgi:hypothetical protein
MRSEERSVLESKALKLVEELRSSVRFSKATGYSAHGELANPGQRVKWRFIDSHQEEVG